MKVIRLTESDLTRIVRRVLQEQQTPTGTAQGGAQAYQVIKKGITGIGTNNNEVKRGCAMVKTAQDYQTLLNLVKTNEKTNTVMAWIMTDYKQIMGVGGPHHHSMGNRGGGQNTWDKDGYYTGPNTQVPLFCARTMEKFGGNAEMQPFTSGTYYERR